LNFKRIAFQAILKQEKHGIKLSFKKFNKNLSLNYFDCLSFNYFSLGKKYFAL